MQLPRFAIPAGIATVSGIGLDLMSNALAQYWPDAPHWWWAVLFWSGGVLTLAFPAWALLWGTQWLGGLWERKGGRAPTLFRATMELGEIACLAAGKEPSLAITSGLELQLYRLLRDAANDGRLEMVSSEGRENFSEQSQTTVDSLVKFLERHPHSPTKLLILAHKWKENPQPRHYVLEAEPGRFTLGSTGKLHAPTVTVRMDVPIWRAVEYVQGVIKNDDSGQWYPRSRAMLRQAAVDGRIKVRGRKQLDVSGRTQFSKVHTDIPASYWEKSTLTAMTAAEIHQDDDGTHTHPETAFAWGPKGVHEKNQYTSLRVDMREVEAHDWGAQ